MDENRRRVVLYGDSLILAGVRAGLAQHPDLQVLSLDASLDNPLDAVRACCPATFIFDMDAVGPGFQLSLLQTPGLRLVGIDPETHQALVWSGREEAAVAAADLINLICEKEAAEHDPVSSETWAVDGGVETRGHRDGKTWRSGDTASSER